MREIREIPISCVRMDRYPLNPTMIGLLTHMSSGGTVPPIKVALRGDGTYEIRDGRHRVLAHKLLGMKHIRCIVSPKPLRHV
jgi:ParB-like chromosome segregation protein Spo0J